MEFSYNLNNVKEVSVTSSFLTLPEYKRNCQERESMSSCITNKYREELMDKCECLPLKLGVTTKVDKCLNLNVSEDIFPQSSGSSVFT